MARLVLTRPPHRTCHRSPNALPGDRRRLAPAVPGPSSGTDHRVATRGVEGITEAERPRRRRRDRDPRPLPPSSLSSSSGRSFRTRRCSPRPVVWWHPSRPAIPGPDSRPRPFGRRHAAGLTAPAGGFACMMPPTLADTTGSAASGPC